VLGAVRAFRGEREIDLGPRRVRLMVALLVARAGRMVTLAELVGLFWEGEPPARARNVVHRYVGVIRRALEPGLAVRAEGSWLKGVPGGYLLRTDAGSVDLVEFRELAERARQAGPEAAVSEYAAALRLWTGAYAEDLDRAHPDFAAADRERAEVARDAAVVAMWAGRSAELPPAPAGEVMPAAPAGPDPAAGRLAVPAQLPASLRFFGGRAAELAALSEALRRRPGVIAIDGIPGVGKSTLAVHWARMIADGFPDGQLFVNLRGFDRSGVVMSAEEALGGFLTALGVPSRAVPSGVDDRTGLFRTLTMRRRLLIVLDNARDADQVLPLLPSAPESLVLVTSRSRLTGLAVRAAAELINLDLPSAADARDNVRLRLDGGTEPSAEELDAIVTRCGRLPLALAIVAARAAGRDGGLKSILDELEETRGSLEAFEDDVRSVFLWSYRQLSPEAARMFRLLSANSGPDAALPLIASIAGLPRARAARLVRELTGTRLLTEHVPGRYSQHDLIRVYAAELAAEREPEPERAEAAARLLDHLDQTVHAAAISGVHQMLLLPAPPPRSGVTPEDLPEAEAALAWFEAESANAEAALADAHRQGRNPWRMAVILGPYFHRTTRIGRWRVLARTALAMAVEAGDQPAEAHIRGLLAGIELSLGGHEMALDHLRIAHDIFVRAGDEPGEAAMNFNTATVLAGRGEGEDRVVAVRHLERAAELSRRHGMQPSLSKSLRDMGNCLLHLGRAEAGIEALAEAMEIATEYGTANSRANVFMSLGSGLIAAGRPEPGIEALAAAIALHEEINGSRLIRLDAMIEITEAYVSIGQLANARAARDRADTFLRAHGAGLADPEITRRLAGLAETLSGPVN